MCKYCEHKDGKTVKLDKNMFKSYVNGYLDNDDGTHDVIKSYYCPHCARLITVSLEEAILTR